MAMRKIVKKGDDLLRKTSKEVKVFDRKLSDLLDDMIETMHKTNGVGLAAPQVGILRRAVI
ncbi:MAG: peptide deformylase, partial [Clostridiales bacterium]|nr:peptide deformylase [Clostridiales bacterium]